jgi:hypothetical protein
VVAAGGIRPGQSHVSFDWLDAAVFNNATWCEQIARAQGIPSTRAADAWFCDHPMPPFYPNLVTLVEPPVQRAHIARLSGILAPGWGVKDSYAALDLDTYGFEVIVDGQWYVRPPDIDSKTPVERRDQVRPVRTPADLSRWVTAWGETPNDTEIFVPAILGEPGVEFLMYELEGEISAGLATNVGDRVVGISNAFGEATGIAACIQRVVDRYQDFGIVGYGSDDEIAQLALLKFEAIGRVRVWLAK